MLNSNVESRAMLVHHHINTNNIDITTHAVMELGDGQFTLGAGRAMSIIDKDSLVALLLNESGKGEFLDESILVSSRSVLCWYRKPCIADIPFSDGRIRAAIPGLIFVAAAGDKFRCFAYKGKGRPSPDTKLHYAPFGNVYREGDFCTGNASVPGEISRANIPNWEAFVLDATNTHSGTVNPVRRVEGIDQLKAFYKQLGDAGAKSFPARSLKPFNTNASYHGDSRTCSTLAEVLFKDGQR